MTLENLFTNMVKLQALKPKHYAKISKMFAQEATTHNVVLLTTLINDLQTCKR